MFTVYAFYLNIVMTKISHISYMVEENKSKKKEDKGREEGIKEGRKEGERERGKE